MICFILGYGAKAKPLLEKLLREEGIRGYVLTKEECLSYLSRVREAKVVFIYASELPDEVVKAIRESGAKVISTNELSNAPTEVVEKAMKYYLLGGEENLRNLIKYLASLAGMQVSYGDPKEVPMHGIYHPKYGLFTNLMSYLSKYPLSNAPLIGVLFWRGAWLYGDLSPVKELINALESEGLGVIPVFTYGKDQLTGLGHERSETVREFFMINGKPVIDALISLISFGISSISNLSELGVPVIAPVRTYYQSIEEWLGSPQGIDYMTQVYAVILPELVGGVEPIVVGGARDYGGYKVYEPYPPHIKYVAKRVKKWVELRRKPRRDVRIAIVLINPPCKGLEANVAVGMGLDVPESVVRFLHRLKEEGYYVGNELPRSGEELIKLILKKKALSEFRWTSVEDIVKSGGAADFVTLEEYMEWFNELPKELRERIIKDWGHPKDVLEGRVSKELVGMVYEGKFVIPGIRFGNVFITPQPKFGCAGPRCDGRVCRVLHDPTITPPHQWFAVYRWITRKFRADVIIHFGTHGYLEFRPGKGVGLTPSCVPEATIDDVPHLYVYVVSNPMEGVVAKRRGYAVIIDHLYPPMTLPKVLEKLDDLLNQYVRARDLGDECRRKRIYELILDEARRGGIKVSDPSNEEGTVEEIHRYLDLIRGTQINLGLHILGNPPRGARELAEYVVTTMTYDTRSSPSIRRLLANYVGINYEELRKDPLGVTCGVPNRELLRKLHDIAVNALERILKGEGIAEAVKDEVIKAGLRPKGDLSSVIKAFTLAKDVALKIRECVRECDALIKGLSGSYVEPGPAGSLTMGKYEVLPTGRNFYAVDPRSLPTRAAWSLGVEAAEKLLNEFRRRHGRYPETVGEVLWSIDGLKADGEQLAKILYLLGVKPVWRGNAVVGLEVIPLKELGRPRIDVVVRVSGIVRDTLPNYIHLIDEAVEKVVVLNEPPEMNYVRKHYLEYLSELIKLGKDISEARRLARYRVFSSAPGTYGAGVNLAVEASAWRSEEDLGKVWIKWSGYAYGRGYYGIAAHEALMLNLRHVDVISRNHVSDEHDITNCCCYFAHHGGFKVAVKALTGRDVDTVHIDTRDVTDVKVVDIRDEVERVVRSKLLNDEWIKEMMKHGYRGASEFSKKILHLYGWHAVAGVVSDWVFNELARKYVINEEMREWFMKHNPYALEEISRRLLEAAERGLWRPPKELLEELRRAYSEVEGILEEGLSGGEVQGGVISIYTPKDDPHWLSSIKEVEELWRRLGKGVG